MNMWGWATWRRAWNQFDLNMPGYREFKMDGGVRRYLLDRDMSNWLTMYLDDALNEGSSSFGVLPWLTFFTAPIGAVVVLIGLIIGFVNLVKRKN